jgi:hypothetical protein
MQPILLRRRPAGREEDEEREVESQNARSEKD